MLDRGDRGGNDASATGTAALRSEAGSGDTGTRKGSTEFRRRRPQAVSAMVSAVPRPIQMGQRSERRQMRSQLARWSLPETGGSENDEMGARTNDEIRVRTIRGDYSNRALFYLVHDQVASIEFRSRGRVRNHALVQTE